MNVTGVPATALPLAAIDTAGTGRPVIGTVTELVNAATCGAPMSTGETPATAVTTAAVVVVSVVVTEPFASVFAFAGVTLPDVVVNPTGVKLKGLLAASVTTAVTVVVPPPNGNASGLAVTATRPTDTAPTTMLKGLASTPPALAVMTAVPDAVPAENRTMARPALLVTLCAGSIVPSVVENAIVAPGIGWPPLLRSSAVSVAVPLTETVRFGVVSVNVEPEGVVGDSDAQLDANAINARMASFGPTSAARRSAVMG
jgi:hypothetical protein